MLNSQRRNLFQLVTITLCAVPFYRWAPLAYDQPEPDSSQEVPSLCLLLGLSGRGHTVKTMNTPVQGFQPQQFPSEVMGVSAPRTNKSSWTWWGLISSLPGEKAYFFQRVGFLQGTSASQSQMTTRWRCWGPSNLQMGIGPNYLLASLNL